MGRGKKTQVKGKSSIDVGKGKKEAIKRVGEVQGGPGTKRQKCDPETACRRLSSTQFTCEGILIIFILVFR